MTTQTENKYRQVMAPVVSFLNYHGASSAAGVINDLADLAMNQEGYIQSIRRVNYFMLFWCVTVMLCTLFFNMQYENRYNKLKNVAMQFCVSDDKYLPGQFEACEKEVNQYD